MYHFSHFELYFALHSCVFPTNIYIYIYLLRQLSVVLQQEGLYKYYDLNKVATLLSGIVEMDALSLNYWLKKLVMEVARKTGERYRLVNYLRNSLCYATPSSQLKSRLVTLNKDLMVEDFF